MKHIVDGVLRYQQGIHSSKAALFQRLAVSQSPSVMFVGCADSRVVPEMLTDQNPGELFVVRNAGNIVPPSSTPPGGVTASIEYAVSVLGVSDIIICGHSGCGAMSAILRDPKQLDSLPAVARWIRHADAARDRVAAGGSTITDEARLASLVHENVLTQIGNLMTHSFVAEAVSRNQLRLHGWVYDIGSGEVETYDSRSGTWGPISAVAEQDGPADATPAS